MKKLDNFVKDLEDILGDNLASVLMFGSQVPIEPENLKSNINLMIILEHLSADDLKNISKPVKKWIKAKNPIPVVMGKAEWYSSFDVYALEYSDIKDKHRVIYGANLAKDINVDKHYLRLQCESELKSLYLKYRNHYLLDMNSDKAMRELADNVIKTLLVIFRGVIRLKGDLVPEASEYVILQAANYMDLDCNLLVKMAKIREKQDVYGKQEIREVSSKLVSVLQDILRQLDAMRY